MKDMIATLRQNATMAMNAFLANQTEENYMAWITAQDAVNALTLDALISMRLPSCLCRSWRVQE